MTGTLADIEGALPNGLHDAEVHAIRINYTLRQLEIDLDVWVGVLGTGDPSRREIYRPARLTFSNLGYWVMEAPDDTYSWESEGPHSVNVGEGQPPGCTCVLPPVPAKSFLAWFYVSAFNRFWHVTAENVSLAWTGEEVDHS